VSLPWQMMGESRARQWDTTRTKWEDAGAPAVVELPAPSASARDLRKAAVPEMARVDATLASVSLVSLSPEVALARPGLCRGDMGTEDGT
jgi:hypothetical protein